jgi:hypothetical protein
MAPIAAPTARMAHFSRLLVDILLQQGAIAGGLDVGLK